MSANIAPVAAGQVLLNDLIAGIRDAHASVVSASNSAIDNAVTAGKLLIEAKKQTPRGQWRKFLKRCGVRERQSQCYMKLAELVEANPTSKSDSTDLSIEQAIKRLSPPKTHDRPQPAALKQPGKHGEPTKSSATKTRHTDIIEALARRIGRGTDARPRRHRAQAVVGGDAARLVATDRATTCRASKAANTDCYHDGHHPRRSQHPTIPTACTCGRAPESGGVGMMIARWTRQSPRIARIRGIGVAEITAAQCECGLPIGPGDIERIGESKLRAICAGCHCDLFQISRTWWEAAHEHA